VTDGPDDLLRQLLADAGAGADDLGTPGPEASPQDDAFVTGLLASLHDDDPPMPDDVIRRLDAVLAEERRSAPRAAGGLAAVPDLPGATGPVPDAEGAPSAPPGNVTVLPTAQARRRGPSTRSFRWIGGIAAAGAAVVGLSVLTGGLGGLGQGSGADTAAGGAPYQNSLIQDSNTAYSSADIAQQAEGLVDKAVSKAPLQTVSPQVEPSSLPPDSQPETTLTPTATDATAATATPDPRVEAAAITEADLPGCIDQLTEGQGATALLVDQGTYNGQEAALLVLPAEDGAYDVWVVAAGCDADTAEVLDFRRVTP
jgi:hypothetical protein